MRPRRNCRSARACAVSRDCGYHLSVIPTANEGPGTPEVIESLRSMAPWHMDVALRCGTRTVAGNRGDYARSDHDHVIAIDPDEIRSTLEHLYPDGLRGKSFLDVGCNAGGYSFLARTLGASRTLGFDVRDHWIDQARFVRDHWDGETSGMRFEVAHVHDIDLSEGFDLTLFKGVFYHLPAPVHSLLRLCDATREVIIVDSASRSDIPENTLATNFESRSHVMSGVDGLAWMPGGPQAVIDILKHAGFQESHVAFWLKELGSGPTPHWGRFRVIAAREPGRLRVPG